MDALSPYTYQQVLGWARRRASGGANQITQAEPTGTVACPPCVDLRRPRKGGPASPGQGALL